MRTTSGSISMCGRPGQEAEPDTHQDQDERRGDAHPLGHRCDHDDATTPIDRDEGQFHHRTLSLPCSAPASHRGCRDPRAVAPIAAHIAAANTHRPAPR